MTLISWPNFDLFENFLENNEILSFNNSVSARIWRETNTNKTFSGKKTLENFSKSLSGRRHAIGDTDDKPFSLIDGMFEKNIAGGNNLQIL